MQRRIREEWEERERREREEEDEKKKIEAEKKSRQVKDSALLIGGWSQRYPLTRTFHSLSFLNFM